jgi:hypothetical protein
MNFIIHICVSVAAVFGIHHKSAPPKAKVEKSHTEYKAEQKAGEAKGSYKTTTVKTYNNTQVVVVSEPAPAPVPVYTAPAPAPAPAPSYETPKANEPQGLALGFYAEGSVKAGYKAEHKEKGHEEKKEHSEGCNN